VYYFVWMSLLFIKVFFLVNSFQINFKNRSSHNKKHTLPTELTKVPLHDLSHIRYFQRELTHTLTLRELTHAARFYYFWTILISPNSKHHFFPPLHLQKPKKMLFFWVKIFISNHCKLSWSKFLHSSIKYQVMYHLNSFDFAGFWAWFVSFGKQVERELTHAVSNLS